MKVLLGQKVEYYKYNKDNSNIKELQGIATFLEFSMTIESLEYVHNVEAFPTAIIRLDDGSLKNIYVEFIKFIEND